MTIRVGTVDDFKIPSEKVMELYLNHWNRKIALSNEKFYTWQFIKSNFKLEKDTCCVAVNASNELIGVMGVNKRTFSLNNCEVEGAELTTWIVRPDYQNKGVGPKIINHLKDKYDVLIGMGITKDALAVYLRNGFRYLKAIPRFIKVLDWSKIDKYTQATPLAKKVARSWSSNVKQYDYCILEATKPLVDDTYVKFARESNLFSRNYENISWRYFEHPTFHYETAIIKPNTEAVTSAFVSLRVEKTNDGLEVLHVVDLFGEKDSYDAAISYINDFAKNKNIPIIDFFCTNSLINSFFIKGGWFSTLDDDYFSFPHLFQPIELRNPATTSLIYWVDEGNINESESFWDNGRMYITKEDCDFDRPVA